MTTAKRVAKQIILLFANPYKAFLIAFVVYFLLSFVEKTPWAVSEYPYFNYLADAFLHGQFNFRLIPPSTHDLIFFDNKYYPYWLPFPALILMPFIMIFGVNFSDILFTLIIGSLNVSLFSYFLYILTLNKIVELDQIKRSLLVIFFAFGTVYLTMVPLGRVWFTSLVIGVSCTLLTYIFAFKNSAFSSFLLAGLAISAAMLTRMHLLIVGLWPAWYLLSKNWFKPKKQLFGWILAGITSIMVTIGFIFFYNFSRFGNIFDVGTNSIQSRYLSLLRLGWRRFLESWRRCARGVDWSRRRCLSQLRTYPSPGTAVNHPMGYGVCDGVRSFSLIIFLL